MSRKSDRRRHRRAVERGRLTPAAALPHPEDQAAAERAMREAGLRRGVCSCGSTVRERDEDGVRRCFACGKRAE